MALCRYRWGVALPHRCGAGIALLPAGFADIRRPLVLSACRGQPTGAGPRRLAKRHGRARALRRQHLVDASGALARPAFAHLEGQVASTVAHGAAGMAPVQAADPGNLPQPRPLWRHVAGRRGGKLGVPGQVTPAIDSGRSRTACCVATGAEPLAPRSASAAGASGARQGVAAPGALSGVASAASERSHAGTADARTPPRAGAGTLARTQAQPSRQPATDPHPY
ncbi:hypothetical protein D3C84_185720 [compost metagenome]